MRAIKNKNCLKIFELIELRKNLTYNKLIWVSKIQFPGKKIQNTWKVPFETFPKYPIFQGALGRCGKVCERPSDEKVLQTSLHISDLPTEIILYIFKWVVSRDLDVRSLEYLGLVCRGFYILARDPEIWRLACTKVWRSSVGLSPKAMGYSTWRQMFQERYRVNFHGCYISKTSYLRYGENSFQDQFYRPVHLIEYYRYMRFFPEGRVLMLTTPDEPVNCVGKLKDRFPQKKEVLVGKYEIHEDIVMILLKKSEQRRQKLPRETKRQQNCYAERDTNTFYLEMRINTAAKKRRFCQLEWKQYSVSSNSKWIPSPFTIYFSPKFILPVLRFRYTGGLNVAKYLKIPYYGSHA